MDGLASGLSVVAASASALTTSPPPNAGERAAQATLHRSALKAYAFFLAWVQAQANDEAAAAVAAGGGAAAAPAPARGRGRRGGAAAPADSWTWDAGRERAARAWAALASTDLRALFAPAPVADGLLARWVASSVALLAAPAGARDRAVRDAATTALAAAASSRGQAEAVAAAAVDALRRAEHLPGPLADVAAAAADAAGDDRLAVELLRAVATADPASYEGLADAAAARAAGALLVELADRLPRAVCGHVALLLPVLGGKAHALRSGVVGAMAVLVHRACGDPRSDGGDAEPPASHAARLRTKAHLLDVLTERARDVSAFTRARVLAAWAYLADKGALPLGHWDAVTRVAIGRLDDKAALVRRGALALLASLMLYNPFGPALPRARFDASLAEYEERLAAADARARAARAEREGDDTATADFASGAVKLEPGAEPDAAAERAAEAAADAAAVEADADAAAAAEAAASAGLDSDVDQLRALVASLAAASSFAGALTTALPTVVQLLASATLSDVTEALSLLACAVRFGVDGADAALRRALPLVFSREPGVPDAVTATLTDLRLAGRSPGDAAAALVDLGVRASLADAAALDELVGRLLSGDTPRLTPSIRTALWPLTAALTAGAAPGAPTRTAALPRLRSALAVITSLGRRTPTALADRLPALLEAGFTPRDAGCVSAAADALVAAASGPGGAAALDDGARADALRAVTRTLLAPPTAAASGLPDGGWYGAADACLRALLTLHPSPQAATAAVVRAAASRALVTPTGRSLARIVFLTSRIALAQLVAADTHARTARKARLVADMAADAAAVDAGGADALAASDGDDDDDDIGAQVAGLAGAAAADADLEALRDAAEAGVLAPTSPAGALAPLIVAACADRAALAAAPALAAAAPLALATLMAVDGRVCEAHLGALFGAASDATLPPRVRSSLVVAAGDLAVRFPNAVEPWTAALYAPLDAPEPGVRRDALLVLSHLVLNDMVKVKGHAARLAARVVDADPRTSALASLFFHELARRAHKGSNPVYNLLPDVLSSLAADGELSATDFRTIMETLLSHVGKERHADALVDKLLARLSPDTPVATVRGVAFCLAQLALSEKGVRRVVEGVASYRHWLADGDVVASIKAVAVRARRLPKASPALKADLDAWEERVDATAAELGGGGAEADAAAAAEPQPSASTLASPTGVAAATQGVRRMSLVGDGDGGASPPRSAAPRGDGEENRPPPARNTPAAPSPAKAVALTPVAQEEEEAVVMS